MENYKSPVNRLVHLFKKGRDVWKARAAEKQKRIRALEVKVRDLSISRDRWKQRAKTAEKNLDETQLPSARTNCSDDDVVRTGEFIPADEFSTQIPARHQFPVFVMQLAIEQFIVSLNSLRGCQSNFDRFSQFFSLPTPSFSNIRNWLLRAGLYQLQKPFEKCTDWIFILDMTIELGTAKSLVILGIRKTYLSKLMSQSDFSGLKHQDVKVLSIEVCFSTSGEIIEQHLEKLVFKGRCSPTSDFGSWWRYQKRY